LTCSISRVTWCTQLRHYCSARHHYEGSAHGIHRPIRLCAAHRGERAAILAGATPPPPPTARHSLFGECNCAGAQLLTRLHTDATRCGLNITCALCSRFPPLSLH
jgi:hypothetical protein